jgi:hypothetical protein
MGEKRLTVVPIQVGGSRQLHPTARRSPDSFAEAVGLQGEINNSEIARLLALPLRHQDAVRGLYLVDQTRRLGDDRQNRISNSLSPG